ncbi:MAG: N-acetyl-alpha-D-muramate 1-phosphate uridylyltransferase [Actinomycetota bacterium]|nr:N-acetyl-alpha-D-muramate 1-phosphate uridylyltransferase [Actinomycetota bacterium]
MYPVAVLAGGLGTRMAKRTGPRLPKALLEVAGRPFIDFKLGQLAEEGATRVVMLLGHGAGAIAEHVGDGAAYGLDIEILHDGEALLGTGGAVRRARPLLGEAFWVTYGDTFLQVPMAEVEEAFRGCGRQGLMTVFKNADEWDASNVALREGLVAEYRKGAPSGTFTYIDYGMSILTAGAFAPSSPGAAFDLGEVLQSLIAGRELAGFEVAERFYEIGSEAGYEETDAYLRERVAGEVSRGGR